MNGKIKFYNEKKGYGFILSDTNENVFFHISAVNSAEDLCRGQKVQFEYQKTPKGLSATSVDLCDNNNSQVRFIDICGVNYKISNICEFSLMYRDIYICQCNDEGYPNYVNELPSYYTDKTREMYKRYTNQPVLYIRTYHDKFPCDYYNLEDPKSIEKKYEELCKLLQ